MISQQQTQRQHLKILPQQIQLLNLYFLNSLELEQRMKNEMEENPFLEMTAEEQFDEGEKKPDKDEIRDYQDWEEYGYNDVPDYRQEYQNYFDSDVAPQMAIASAGHFKDDLRQQLRMRELPERDMQIAEYLIDVLDNHGLMDRDLDEVTDDLSFHLQSMVDTADVERSLAIIQDLEPIGVGAKSVQECLMLQLSRGTFTAPEARPALRLVKNHYKDLM